MGTESHSVTDRQCALCLVCMPSLGLISVPCGQKAESMWRPALRGPWGLFQGAAQGCSGCERWKEGVSVSRLPSVRSGCRLSFCPTDCGFVCARVCTCVSVISHTTYCCAVFWMDRPVVITKCSLCPSRVVVPAFPGPACAWPSSVCHGSLSTSSVGSLSLSGSVCFSLAFLSAHHPLP